MLNNFISLFCFAENISHSFSAEKVQYYTMENVILTCIGTIDVPDFTRIYIEKVNVTLYTSEKNTVQFITSNLKINICKMAFINA